MCCLCLQDRSVCNAMWAYQSLSVPPMHADGLCRLLNFLVSAQVALIERSNTRHIVNLPNILAACNGELQAAGRQAECTALSFDGVNDFPGLLRELHTVDVLVRPLPGVADERPADLAYCLSCY